MPGPVYVLGDLRIEPSEGHHRHTARRFLAIPHKVVAFDPTRERAIDGDEPVGHRSGCNGLVLNYSVIRQQRHGRDRPDAEERQPELQVLAHCGPPSQARRFWEALLNRCYDPERCGEGKAELNWLRGSCATPPGNDQSRVSGETLRLRPLVGSGEVEGADGHGRLCDARGSFDSAGWRALQLGPNWL